MPGQNYVEWFDCRRKRHKKRQPCMLLLSRGSATNQSDTWSEKWNWFGQNTRHGSNIVSNIQLCCCSIWSDSSSMHRKDRRTRSNDLVLKVIRSRTKRTDNPRRFLCFGWPSALPRSTPGTARSYRESRKFRCAISNQDELTKELLEYQHKGT